MDHSPDYEHAVLDAIEDSIAQRRAALPARATGAPVGAEAAINWPNLVANVQKILPLILQIISIFGMAGAQTAPPVGSKPPGAQ